MPAINSSGELQCRFCGEWIAPQELTFTNAYWVGHGSMIRSFEHPEQVINIAAEPKFPCHRSCKREGYRREAYDCQCIDAACNDCIHFKRLGTHPKPDNPFKGDRRLTDEEQKTYLSELIQSGSHYGQCLKFNRNVATTSQTCEKMPCFEHRRAHESTRVE